VALAFAALGIMWRTWTKLQIRRLNHCVTFKDHCPTKTNSSKRLWYCANVHVFHIIFIVVVYIELYRPASDKMKFIIDILTCIIWSAHANAGALCDDSVNLFVWRFVRLSPAKFVKSFARWQHLAASGGLSHRLRYTSYTNCAPLKSISASLYLIHLVKPRMEGRNEMEDRTLTL